MSVEALADQMTSADALRWFGYFHLHHHGPDGPVPAPPAPSAPERYLTEAEMDSMFRAAVKRAES